MNMKNTITTIVCLFLINSLFSQKMITRSGEIKFEASVPNFEVIAGTNNTVSCVFDKSNGNISTLALIKAFRFKSPLMEEHFNENYMESDLFPKSSFNGKVLNFDASKLTQGKTIPFDIEGDLSIHGVTKKIKTKIYFTSKAEKLTATSNFTIKTMDFENGNEVPSLIKSRIAENATISLNFDLLQ